MRGPIIVTRHPALAKHIVATGVAPKGTPVYAHATADIVRGRDVVGVLPPALAALAATVTAVPMDLTRKDRGVELSIERVRKVAGDSVTTTTIRCESIAAARIARAAGLRARRKNPIEVCATPRPLSSRARRTLPDRAYGLPKERKYPMYVLVRGDLVGSPSHASNAKGRAKQQRNAGKLTAAQYRRIVAKADKVLAMCKMSSVKVNPTTSTLRVEWSKKNPELVRVSGKVKVRGKWYAVKMRVLHTGLHDINLRKVTDHTTINKAEGGLAPPGAKSVANSMVLDAILATAGSTGSAKCNPATDAGALEFIARNPTVPIKKA